MQKEKKNMYRPSRISKPVSNRREHSQRNQYARNSLQKKRLFGSKRSRSKFSNAMIALIVIAFFFFWKTIYDFSSKPTIANNLQSDAKVDTAPAKITTKSAPFDEFKCSFREYKPHRYYPVDDISEKFLSDSEYIRGELPFVINPRSDGIDNGFMPKKICTDTSEWENVQEGYRPFSDGQNPSFISLAHKFLNPDTITVGDASTAKTLADLYGSEGMKSKYLGLLLFGDSQCRWNMSTEELDQNKFSPLDKAPSKRSMVMILNENLDPIGRAVLELEHDAAWGSTRKKFGVKQNEDGNSFKRSIVELDDARLFFHGGKLHVLYRNGPYFGYDKQIQNPIHLTKIGDDKFEAVIKASESFPVCCGRNIAFISEIPEENGSEPSISSELIALTWIDPVTTENVQTSEKDVKTKRKLMEHQRRRLKQKNKSSIHGTNGYLVPLPSTSELLGVAHFHRPENRDQSDYARHGHHYTHAFFTLEQKSGGDTKSFKLKRISNEFVFMAPSSSKESVGDVIQFASGIDLVESDESGKLMISYGINDCEAALLFLDMKKVQEILLPVKDGEEVFHLMKKLA